MFLDPNLTIWENLSNSIKYTYILCIAFFIVLLIGNLTAKTEEKKNEIGKFTVVGTIMAILVILSSSLMLPIVKANMSAPVEETTSEKKEVNSPTQYESSTSKMDCRLCSDNSNELLSFYWGENNLAVLDLNTFDIHRLEINRYDDNKNLIEKKAGYFQTNNKNFQDGTRMSFHIESDRGYAEGSIMLNENSKLSIDHLSTYLCSDCLTDLMNQYFYKGDHWNIALLNFENKTIKPLDEYITGFSIGDFIIRSRYDKTDAKIDLLTWYSPVRYE